MQIDKLEAELDKAKAEALVLGIDRNFFVPSAEAYEEVVVISKQSLQKFETTGVVGNWA